MTGHKRDNSDDLWGLKNNMCEEQCGIYFCAACTYADFLSLS